MMQINCTSIETGLWAIERYMMCKYGVDAAKKGIEPLRWYIETGRASIPFIERLLEAKPFMVGRELHKGGTYEDSINRIKKYLKVN